MFRITVLLLAWAGLTQAETTHEMEKQAAVNTINSLSPQLTELSDQIWAFAETALSEHRSAALLADWAEANGFRVERGVGGLPTAFTAEYGSGEPLIGIMGEYDALPGISQKASVVQEALVSGAAGHGCGHNLFGVASLAAATSIKQLIEDGKLTGTIRFFGTPAEESVGGKLYMLREGVFDGVDIMLAWHPSDKNLVDTVSTQALVDLVVEFRGRAAHSAYDPWNGRSAADGAELFTAAVNMMREHVPPTARMHYVITDAGNVPNVVSDYARVWIWLRDKDNDGVKEMLARVRKIARGAALSADVSSTLTVQSGDWNMLVNMTGARLAHANMSWLDPLVFDDQEQAFAQAIQRANGVSETGLNVLLEPLDENPGLPEGGSTDVADVSWMVPTINIQVTTAPSAAPWHGWSVVATGGMSIGHKGMIWAANALAATMVDLYKEPAVRAAIREEFDRSTEGVTYKTYIPDGPPPLPENNQD
jgi:aminobenzoyl-glutamate utilization protein B